MNKKIRKVFYVNVFGLPLFAERLFEMADMSLTGITDTTDEASADDVLVQSHVYQISSGVHDMQARYLARAELLERAPRLLMVSAIGAGYDTVDLAECSRRGIVVVNQSGGASAQAVAEHSLAMMLGLGKRIGEADRAMRRAPNVVRGNYTGRNMHGKTVGLIGFGQVARRLAAVCVHGFGMRVLVASRSADAATLATFAAHASSLADLLRASDYVVVCCALTAHTRGLIGSAQFALMQRHAFFITTTRAGIHDEAALFDALTRGQIAGAGIDVWDTEPPPIGHPLLQLDNVIATPHTAGATVESRTGTAESAARQIAQALQGQHPAQLLNPTAWPLFLRRLHEEFPELAERAEPA